MLFLQPPNNMFESLMVRPLCYALNASLVAIILIRVYKRRQSLVLSAKNCSFLFCFSTEPLLRASSTINLTSLHLSPVVCSKTVTAIRCTRSRSTRVAFFQSRARLPRSNSSKGLFLKEVKCVLYSPFLH